MGREAASAFARWFVLENFPVRAELVAVCDLQDKLLDWFQQVPTVKLLTKDHRELLASPDVDVVYVAVPHNLHEALYLDVLAAGKDLLAEKPFGIDLAAATRIREAAAKSGRDLIERLREAAGGAPTKEEAITAEVGSAQAFAAYNEALHDQIVALADLERITAGGVRVNFPGR